MEKRLIMLYFISRDTENSFELSRFVGDEVKLVAKATGQWLSKYLESYKPFNYEGKVPFKVDKEILDKCTLPYALREEGLKEILDFESSSDSSAVELFESVVKKLKGLSYEL